MCDRMPVWRIGVGLMAAVAIGLGGCRTDGGSRARDGGDAQRVGAAPARMGPILHVVLVRLKDPLDTAACADATLAMVDQIPSITGAFVGLHLETGRDTVQGDYDVCLTMSFESREGLDAYIEHPAHLAILEQWGPRIEWIRIHDAREVRAGG